MGERQLAVEQQARAYIEGLLATANVIFTVQEYETYIPKYNAWSLLADGEKRFAYELEQRDKDLEAERERKKYTDAMIAEHKKATAEFQK